MGSVDGSTVDTYFLDTGEDGPGDIARYKELRDMNVHVVQILHTVFQIPC
jgi:hypothetical protein